MLSLVIPTLNAASHLDRLCLAVGEAADEVIVVDGGSTDDTRAVALRRGARVIDAPRGRGPQLAAGAEAAGGDWLLFLHADSLPGPGWQQAVARHRSVAPDKAAAFRLLFDDPAPQARRLERIVAWRSRRLGLPYGDQGLLIPRRLYDAVGGFRPLPLMEDVDLVRRLGRRRLVLLEAAVSTSAERYRRDGWRLRPLRNLVCLGLYYLGLPPPLIERLYR